MAGRGLPAYHRRMRILVALLVLAACGSKAPAPVEPSPAAADEAAATEPPPPPPPEAAPDKPCDAECAACMDECIAGSDGDYDCEADCM